MNSGELQGGGGVRAGDVWAGALKFVRAPGVAGCCGRAAALRVGGAGPGGVVTVLASLVYATSLQCRELEQCSCSNGLNDLT